MCVARGGFDSCNTRRTSWVILFDPFFFLSLQTMPFILEIEI
jgi:hypothetical protein